MLIQHFRPASLLKRELPLPLAGIRGHIAGRAENLVLKLRAHALLRKPPLVTLHSTRVLNVAQR